MVDTPIAPYVELLRPFHAVLCPRQVLGVRSALLAARLLPAAFPQTSKRVIALSEIDGCYSDGLLVVSGCSVGHRTMRVMDLGKVAVTFFDTETHDAVRIWPRPGVRDQAAEHAVDVASRWQAQRDGYARMPEAELFRSERVHLSPDLLRQLLEPWDGRVACDRCGEDVFYGRHLDNELLTLCRACTGAGYLQSSESAC
jgi:formylmethanofuran dehydrogenase subunit E